MVDGVVYKADVRSVNVVDPGADPLTALPGYVYYGHVPVEMFWLHDGEELPPELEGVSEIYTTEDAIRMGLRPREFRSTLPHTIPVGKVAGKESR